MKTVLPKVSQRRLCRVLHVPRGARRPERVPTHAPRAEAAPLVGQVQRLVQEHPTFGYRRIWALLRFREGQVINRKRVYRILKTQGWFVHQRRVTPRPRVQASRSSAPGRLDR